MDNDQRSSGSRSHVRLESLPSRPQNEQKHGTDTVSVCWHSLGTCAQFNNLALTNLNQPNDSTSHIPSLLLLLLQGTKDQTHKPHHPPTEACTLLGTSQSSTLTFPEASHKKNKQQKIFLVVSPSPPLSPFLFGREFRVWIQRGF
ncbi:hypothetical protein VTO42DRAFT_2873 [Malbranchea cinnamomea]